MSNTRQYLASLRTDAWRTSGARFNAARRLKIRDWFATFSIAMFSAIGVGLVVFQKVYAVPVGGSVDKFLTVLSVFLGLFVIVISLIEWGAAGGKKAEVLHRNAEQLNEFQRKLQQLLAEEADGSIFESERVSKLRLEYESIKSECAHNHEPIDDVLFVSGHRLSPELFNEQGKPKINLLGAIWIRLRSLLASFWYFSLFWMVVGGLFYLTPWSSF